MTCSISSLTLKCCGKRYLPAEKGTKASLFTNLPSWFRKCPGLKTWGVSHWVFSNSTEVKLGIIVTPWKWDCYEFIEEQPYVWWNKTTCSVRTDLWDSVASQLEVSVGDVRQTERNYVAHPLDLVDDSVSVGQVCTVLHARLSGLSNHSVYFSLDFFCGTWRRRRDQKMGLSVTMRLDEGQSDGEGQQVGKCSSKQQITSFPHPCGPTLNLSVLCHVEKSPAQGGRCGLSASTKQVKRTHHQVVLMKTSIHFTVLLVLMVFNVQHFKNTHCHISQTM